VFNCERAFAWTLKPTGVLAEEDCRLCVWSCERVICNCREPDDPPELPKPAFTIKPEPYCLPSIDEAWNSTHSGDVGGSGVIPPPVASSGVVPAVSSQERVPIAGSKPEQTEDAKQETIPEAVAAS
jgi:hypothetical protein